MELRSARWHNALLALGLALVVWPMITTGLFGAPLFGDRLYPLVILGSPFLGWQLPTRVVARIEGAHVRIGSRTARIADLIGIEKRTLWVNFIPTSRHMIFSFRAQESDGLFARMTGVRKLAITLGNVTGGSKAAAAFAAELSAARDVSTPIAALAPPRDAAPAPNEPASASFDADAIMARYLAERRDSLMAAPRTPERPGFGRKGL